MGTEKRSDPAERARAAARPFTTTERVMVAAIGLGSVVIAAIAIVSALVGFLGRVAGGGFDLDVSAFARASELASTQGIGDAQWTEGRLWVTSAPTGERVLIGTGGLLITATWAALALAVAFFCRRLWQGRPFGPALTRTIWFVAGALVAGPAIGRLILDTGTNLLIDRLHLHDPLAIGFSFDANAFGAGLALALVGLAFQFGERLQRDSDGLV